MPADASQILTPFGFTSLESEIYAFLLQESPATGYRVAQALGKAAANTYKAIESLQQKGALLVEDGATRLCRAVPSDELLARLTRDFEWRRAEAELVLARLNSLGEDDRIYALKSSAQVVERARHMIGAAKQVVLVACSANTADQLSGVLAGCARRKVQTHLACPSPPAIPGVRSVGTGDTGSLEELRLVTDGSEYLFALFNGVGEVAQAVWSQSAYLAVCTHRGLAAEFRALGVNVPPVQGCPGFAKLA